MTRGGYRRWSPNLRPRPWRVEKTWGGADSTRTGAGVDLCWRDVDTHIALASTPGLAGLGPAANPRDRNGRVFSRPTCERVLSPRGAGSGTPRKLATTSAANSCTATLCAAPVARDKPTAGASAAHLLGPQRVRRSKSCTAGWADRRRTSSEPRFGTAPNAHHKGRAQGQPGAVPHPTPGVAEGRLLAATPLDAHQPTLTAKMPPNNEGAASICNAHRYTSLPRLVRPLWLLPSGPARCQARCLGAGCRHT